MTTEWTREEIKKDEESIEDLIKRKGEHEKRLLSHETALAAAFLERDTILNPIQQIDGIPSDETTVEVEPLDNSASSPSISPSLSPIAGSSVVPSALEPDVPVPIPMGMTVEASSPPLSPTVGSSVVPSDEEPNVPFTVPMGTTVEASSPSLSPVADSSGEDSSIEFEVSENENSGSTAIELGMGRTTILGVRMPYVKLINDYEKKFEVNVENFNSDTVALCYKNGELQDSKMKVRNGSKTLYLNTEFVEEDGVFTIVINANGRSVKHQIKIYKLSEAFIVNREGNFLEVTNMIPLSCSILPMLKHVEDGRSSSLEQNESRTFKVLKMDTNEPLADIVFHEDPQVKNSVFWKKSAEEAARGKTSTGPVQN